MNKNPIILTSPTAKGIERSKHRSLFASFFTILCMLSSIILLTPRLSAQESVHPIANPETIETNSSSHRAHCIALIIILKQSEQCLLRCQDEASIRAELPKLKALSREMNQLAASQSKLADPGDADIKTAEQYLIEFIVTWKSIKQEIQRLEATGLYKDELLEILRLKS